MTGSQHPSASSTTDDLSPESLPGQESGATAPAVTDWIERTLAAAASGTDARDALADCVVIVDDLSQANLRWANNSLTTNGQMHSRNATVIAITGGDTDRAAGVRSGPVNGVADLLGLLEQAASVAAASDPAEDAMPLIDGGIDPDYNEPATGTTIEIFTDLAPALGQAFSRATEASELLFGFAEHQLTTTWLGSSAGTRRRHRQPMGRIELNAKDTDLVGSAWTGRATADFTDIDVTALYAEASTRLGWSSNRIDLPAGRYETLLPPSALADLMIYALWSMSARDAVEGRNAFASKADPGSTRIGEKLAGTGVRMSSDPGAAGLESAPFAIVRASAGGEYSVFDNGAPVDRVDWISDGALTELIRTRAVARDQDAGFAYPTENLVIEGSGSSSLEEMIAATERGLLLTCLWYIREVDAETLLLTGLTRDGVYLIENGEVVGAVNNFRFNESPVELLGRISEYGASEKTLCREWNDWFTLTAVPPARVPDFNMSTVSAAH